MEFDTIKYEVRDRVGHLHLDRPEGANAVSPELGRDLRAVMLEINRAKRLFRERGWRMFDITGKAVEENASRILELLAVEQEVAFP